MAKGKIVAIVGEAAVRQAVEGDVDRDTLATAVRYLLQVIEGRVPGKSVEVRVPPFGAAQCVEGPGHTRGTPPNVVEMDAQTWLHLATGRTTWADGVAAGRIHASGTRADLTPFVPVLDVV